MSDEETYNLNAGQQAAADGFFQFLLSDEKELIINGPGGVGKTYLMGYLIDKVLPMYFNTCSLMNMQPKYDEVVMTATTNKAADVLGQQTRRPTETIHSFMRLKVTENYSTGRSDLTKKRDFQIHTRKIIFIDESSMIDSQLYRLIQEGTMGCKIIYVGDYCQLTPVAEQISPVYRNNIKVHELTEPMRNAGQPALINICGQLRETVKTGVFQPIEIVPGVIDLLDNDTMPIELQNQFLGQNPMSRVLAYSNNRVIDFNNYIRDYRNLPKTYTVGEIVVNNSAIELGRATISVEAELEIMKVGDPQQILIDAGHNVYLDVQPMDVKDKLGRIFTSVLVPMQAEHLFQLIKHYAKAKNWERYFYLKKTFPDLRPRDAATIHKGQGSTYDNVFVDLGDISKCNMADQVARLLYVGFTRPKNRIFLFGNLAEKYGGLKM